MTVENSRAGIETGGQQDNVPSISQIALKGIRGAIDRLQRTGIAIRRSSSSSLVYRVKRSEENAESNDVFLAHSQLIVKGLHPHVPESLSKQLAASILLRRQILQHQRAHQRKLEPQRENARQQLGGVSQILRDSSYDEHPGAARTASFPLAQEISRPTEQTATDPTSPSTFAASAFHRNILEGPKPVTGPSTITSYSESSPYPSAPKPHGNGKYCQCNWCFEEIIVPDDKTRWRRDWRYVCHITSAMRMLLLTLQDLTSRRTSNLMSV